MVPKGGHQNLIWKSKVPGFSDLLGLSVDLGVAKRDYGERSLQPQSGQDAQLEFRLNNEEFFCIGTSSWTFHTCLVTKYDNPSWHERLQQRKEKLC